MLVALAKETETIGLQVIDGFLICSFVAFAMFTFFVLVFIAIEAVTSDEA